MSLRNRAVDRNALGTVAAKTLRFVDSTQVFVLGIQFFMCIYCLAFYLETSKAERRRRLPYIFLNVLLFVLAAVSTFLYTHIQFRREFAAQTGTEFLLLEDADIQGDFTLAMTVLGGVVIFLGDALLLYRCHILRYADPAWVKLSTLLIYLTSVGFGIFSIYGYSRPVVSRVWAQPTFYGISVLFNITVTTLIAHKLIHSRRQMKEILPERDLSIYTGATAIIIESAVPLTVLGVGCVIANVLVVTHAGNGMARGITINVLNTLYYAFTQLSPSMIIFRVTTGRSWTNDFSSTTPSKSYNPGDRRECTETLRFRHTALAEDVELASTQSIDSSVRASDLRSEQEKPESGGESIGQAV
ncbi:hypothetical protein NMY22_g12362 [Coprinellus aureogranulatus]|nr:hypothetical protein NMY22_g12362 [Coprinellus aureogranulatus]